MVAWIRSLFGPTPGPQLAPDALPAPWAPGRVAILARIVAIEALPDGSLPDPCLTLPDQNAWASGGVFAPGARDQHSDGAPSGRERGMAHELATAFQRAAVDHSETRLTELYEPLLAAGALNVAGPLLARLNGAADPARIALLARWLARRAPDIGAVRIGIAVLGQFGDATDADLFMTLGRHEEFTQPCAVALCKLLGAEQSQTAMWNLARRVHGWGRINVVRELAATRCPQIQQWLVRDGYKNTQMHAYLAHLCAVGGQLLEALRSPQVDDRLLIGAGEIIDALLEGRDGPAQRMHDYADGAAVTLAYLECVLRRRPRQPRVAAALIAIANIDAFALPWESAQLRQARALTRQALAMDYWPALVLQHLREGDDEAFLAAAKVASAFGVDAWEYQFAKQQSGALDLWADLTDTADPQRVERYVALAVEQLDLTPSSARIGPITDGPRAHANTPALDWLCIGLRKFSGKGWPILRAALESAQSTNRSNAVDALAAWRPAHVGSEQANALERAWRTETNAELQQEMEALLHKMAAAKVNARSGT